MLLPDRCNGVGCSGGGIFKGNVETSIQPSFRFHSHFCLQGPVDFSLTRLTHTLPSSSCLAKLGCILALSCPWSEGDVSVVRSHGVQKGRWVGWRGDNRGMFKGNTKTGIQLGVSRFPSSCPGDTNPSDTIPLLQQCMFEFWNWLIKLVKQTILFSQKRKQEESRENHTSTLLLSSSSPLSPGVDILCSVSMQSGHAEPWACRAGCLGWDQIGTGGVASCKLEEALPDNDQCLHWTFAKGDDAGTWDAF